MTAAVDTTTAMKAIRRIWRCSSVSFTSSFNSIVFGRAPVQLLTVQFAHLNALHKFRGTEQDYVSNYSYIICPAGMSQFPTKNSPFWVIIFSFIGSYKFEEQNGYISNSHALKSFSPILSTAVKLICCVSAPLFVTQNTWQGWPTCADIQARNGEKMFGRDILFLLNFAFFFKFFLKLFLLPRF